jgi:hypothetical protein
MLAPMPPLAPVMSAISVFQFQSCEAVAVQLFADHLLSQSLRDSMTPATAHDHAATQRARCSSGAEVEAGDGEPLACPLAKNNASGTANHGLSAVRLNSLATTSTVKPSREDITELF